MEILLILVVFSYIIYKIFNRKQYHIYIKEKTYETWYRSLEACFMYISVGSRGAIKADRIRFLRFFVLMKFDIGL